jgi:nicotinamide-nucleotide amidase
MAEGARRQLGSDWGVAVTGVAGPGGGSDRKPVGLVHFAVAGPDGSSHLERRYGDRRGRDWIRGLSVGDALNLLRLQL